MRGAKITSNDNWSVGDRVKRYSDGAPGVITELGDKGNVWVKWDSSGLQTCINSMQVEKP